MDSYANGYDLYSSYDTASAVGGIFAGLMIFVGVIVLIALIVGIIGIVGQWKVLKKAGQPGWPALIPFYNTYMLCKITGVNPWWILIVLLSPICNIIPVFGSLLCAAVSIYFSILLYVSLANSFGKDTGWAVGLFFLQPFFMLALGVGKSEYLGPKPMDDVIMNKFNSNSANNTASQNVNNNGNTVNTANSVSDVEVLNEQSIKTSFCPNCGTKIEEDSKFCPSCGRRL